LFFKAYLQVNAPVRPEKDAFLEDGSPTAYSKKDIFLYTVNSATTGLVQPPDKIVVRCAHTIWYLVRWDILLKGHSCQLCRPDTHAFAEVTGYDENPCRSKLHSAFDCLIYEIRQCDKIKYRTASRFPNSIGKRWKISAFQYESSDIDHFHH